MNPKGTDRAGKLLPAFPIEGLKIVTIDHVDAEGYVWVDATCGKQKPVRALMTRSLERHLSDARSVRDMKVLVLFEDNRTDRPVIIDVVQDRLNTYEKPAMRDLALQADKPGEVSVDGKVVSFKAKDQIVLRCGKSSITLTKAGKVVIRGAYLLSRSSGANRIRGGSVQIN